MEYAIIALKIFAIYFLVVKTLEILSNFTIYLAASMQNKPWKYSIRYPLFLAITAAISILAFL